MKKNEDICQDMDASDILCFLRNKYKNMSSRSGALSKLKKKYLETKDLAFCDQLKLSYDEYYQINSHRKVQLVKKHSQPRLSIKQMNVLANNILQHSDNPRQLLPCLVLITGIKPTQLLKDKQSFDLPLSTKLAICKRKWPCKNLTYLEMHNKYQAPTTQNIFSHPSRLLSYVGNAETTLYQKK